MPYYFVTRFINLMKLRIQTTIQGKDMDSTKKGEAVATVVVLEQRSQGHGDPQGSSGMSGQGLSTAPAYANEQMCVTEAAPPGIGQGVVEMRSPGQYVMVGPLGVDDSKRLALYRSVAEQVVAGVSELLEDTDIRSRLEDTPDESVADFVRRSVDVKIRWEAPAGSGLDEARERGRRYIEEQMGNATENISLEEAAKLAGITPQAVNDARIAGRLYALLAPSRKRGLRYPRWQFDAAAQRLAPVLAQFRQRHPDCWAIHAFMTQPNIRLEGRTPKDAILDGKVDIARVVGAASANISNTLAEEA
jgi:hypothetical protein